MKLTRRGFLAGGAAVALGAAGAYELVDHLAGSGPTRPAGRLLPEQHLLEGVRFVHQDGVEVLVPPLHHQVVTARVTADSKSLPDAQRSLEQCASRPDKWTAGDIFRVARLLTDEHD